MGETPVGNRRLLAGPPDSRGCRPPPAARLGLSTRQLPSPRGARFREGVEIATREPRIAHRPLPGPDLGGRLQLSIGRSAAVEFRPREGRSIRTTGTFFFKR